ncbi:hypothetical protein [Janibacter indicus]|uniref:hypothetical protein n=1 Tax=Janibacter indicus TaxID=857417 RepID=UPI003EC047F8
MAITFVIPVRHHASIRDWARVQEDLALTVASVRRQTVDDWHCVIVANEDTPLPRLPDDVLIVRVNLPHEPLPDWAGGVNAERRFEATRADKGARVLAGIVEAEPDGHVMIVDYDDFVSCRLAELSSTAPESPGWVIDSGYMYDGRFLSYAQTSGFNGICGTSLIVHSRLLGLESAFETDPAHVRRTLGSHRFLAEDLANLGSPLVRCPFPGAVYRVNIPGSVSGSPTIRRMHFRRQLLTSDPKSFVRNVANLRLSSSLTREFGVPSTQ